jgi:tRNA A-37 threonylcarbamoyl transferase component Bud32
MPSEMPVPSTADRPPAPETLLTSPPAAAPPGQPAPTGEVAAPPNQPGATPAGATLLTGGVVSPMETPPPLPGGGAVAGPPPVPGYEILGELGRGGMGVVYKARHLRLNRIVALKMVLAGGHAGPEDLLRFLSEAEAAARLQHPHIVQIHEIGQHGRLPYFTLEYAGGGSLARKLNHQPQPPAEAARLAELLAEAVQHAHQHGVVHRDLKPANILLTEDGAPKITDFGLAKKLEGGAGLTHTGMILGTPSYMAPEQADGKVQEVGPAADVYALGAVLYEMLTGRPPFQGPTAHDTLRQVIADDPAPPRRLQPRLPRDLEIICLKCLAKEPERRYTSAEALADDLRRFLAGEAIRARPDGPLGRLGRALRRRRVPLAVGLLAVLTLTAGGYLALQGRRAQRLAELRNTVEAGLAAEDWTPAQLDELEGQIARLAELEPGPAAEARSRARERFRKATERLLEPRLEPENVERFERNVQALATRDPGAAAELRQGLRQRRRDWETLFELRAPFAEAEQVFAADDIDVKEGRLTIRSGPRDAADGWALTRVPCAGNVQLEAELDGSWESAGAVGLALNAAREPGRTKGGPRAYALVLSAGAPADAAEAQPPRTLGEARKSEGGLTLEIRRNGLTLSRREVRAAAGPLTLRFRREGDRLTGQVNDEAPLVFLDAFPLGGAPEGAFGLLRRPEARLTRLRARRQAPAAAPSPLERADEQFDGGRYAEALAEYQRQAQEPLATPAGQEARYKAALCLEQLNRPDEADGLLEQVAGVPEGRWAAAAAVRLWQLRLERNRPAEAEAAFTSLAARYRFEDIVAVLPEDSRWRIIGRDYRQLAGAGHFLQRDPDRVGKLERAAAAAAFLQVPLAKQGYIQAALLRAYQVDGRPDQARRAGRAFLERCASARGADRLWASALALTEYCWLLRTQGEAKAGLAELDRWLFAAPGVYPEGAPEVPLGQLLLERVRLQAALGDWDAAEKDLAECFRLSEAAGASRSYLVHSTAHLLRGFLKERRGDRAGALSAWRAGSWQAWRDRLPPGVQPSQTTPYQLSGLQTLHHLIVTALSDELTDAEAEKALGPLLTALAGKEVPPQFAAVVRFPPSALREMWKTPRGRELARRLAFQELPFPEALQTPPLLLVAEVVRQEGFGDSLTAEQDELVWETALKSAALYAQGKIDLTQALQLGMAWKKGVTGFLGWAAVAPALPAEVRGPLAYLLGRRLLRLKKPQEAEGLFRSALADAPKDSPLRRLTQEELDRLSGK